MARPFCPFPTKIFRRPLRYRSMLARRRARPRVSWHDQPSSSAGGSPRVHRYRGQRGRGRGCCAGESPCENTRRGWARPAAAELVRSGLLMDSRDDCHGDFVQFEAPRPPSASWYYPSAPGRGYPNHLFPSLRDQPSDLDSYTPLPTALTSQLSKSLLPFSKRTTQ